MLSSQSCRRNSGGETATHYSSTGDGVHISADGLAAHKEIFHSRCPERASGYFIASARGQVLKSGPPSRVPLLDGPGTTRGGIREFSPGEDVGTGHQVFHEDHPAGSV